MTADPPARPPARSPGRQAGRQAGRQRRSTYVNERIEVQPSTESAVTIYAGVVPLATVAVASK